MTAASASPTGDSALLPVPHVPPAAENLYNMRDTNLARISDDFYVSHWQGLVGWLLVTVSRPVSRPSDEQSPVSRPVSSSSPAGCRRAACACAPPSAAPCLLSEPPAPSLPYLPPLACPALCSPATAPPSPPTSPPAPSTPCSAGNWSYQTGWVPRQHGHADVSVVAECAGLFCGELVIPDWVGARMSPRQHAHMPAMAVCRRVKDTWLWQGLASCLPCLLFLLCTMCMCAVQDMFHSRHSVALMHATARAISGERPSAAVCAAVASFAASCCLLCLLCLMAALSYTSETPAAPAVLTCCARRRPHLHL
jgi:hypothetical protein